MSEISEYCGTLSYKLISQYLIKYGHLDNQLLHLPLSRKVISEYNISRMPCMIYFVFQQEFSYLLPKNNRAGLKYVEYCNFSHLVHHKD